MRKMRTSRISRRGRKKSCFLTGKDIIQKRNFLTPLKTKQKKNSSRKNKESG
jgi:hypothetical protein